MARTDALIYFVCFAAEHRDGAGVDTATLTIHERKWAFCPHSAQADGHEWRPTDGVPVGEVRRLIEAAQRGSRESSERRRA